MKLNTFCDNDKYIQKITPDIFLKKYKQFFHDREKKKTLANNLRGVDKHFIPAFKEWFNSVYSFNKKTIKLLPVLDKISFALVKGYLNFYNTKLEKNARSIRARRRIIRKTINKTLVGKLNLKHTNDNVTIFTYFYNRRIRFYLNKIKNAETIDNIYSLDKYKLSINNIKENILKIESTISSEINILDYKSGTFYIKSLEKKYINSYLYKLMQKEITSISIRQLNYIEKSKVNNVYLLGLVNVLESVYKKKVVFNFVSLKHIYNNASILSQSLVIKLKNKSNNPSKVLIKALDMFKIPKINRFTFNKNYNKKVFLESAKLNDNWSGDKLPDVLPSKDVLEELITRPSNYNLDAFRSYDINQILNILKFKFTSGVRIAIAGRLTKRNTAERSIHKLRYKGNIRNMDSSDKGLSTTLVRGFSNSNLFINKSSGKVRTGSFGVKTMVNTIT